MVVFCCSWEEPSPTLALLSLSPSPGFWGPPVLLPSISPVMSPCSQSNPFFKPPQLPDGSPQHSDSLFPHPTFLPSFPYSTLPTPNFLPHFLFSIPPFPLHFSFFFPSPPLTLPFFPPYPFPISPSSSYFLHPTLFSISLPSLFSTHVYSPSSPNIFPLYSVPPHPLSLILQASPLLPFSKSP